MYVRPFLREFYLDGSGGGGREGLEALRRCGVSSGYPKVRQMADNGPHMKPDAFPDVTSCTAPKPARLLPTCCLGGFCCLREVA